MNNDELNRLRILAAGINESIIETTAIIAKSRDAETRSLVTSSLADLKRAWLILDAQLRKK